MIRLPKNHHTLEDDEPHPSTFPFEFEEDLFQDFGNALNFPVYTFHDIFLLEHIKGLSTVMSITL
jgi:hypothetical protein